MSGFKSSRQRKKVMSILNPSNSDNFHKRIKENRDKNKEKYVVVYDDGTPSEETYNSREELEKGLKDFYERNKDSDYQYDAKVYDKNNNDITESQDVTEIVSDIINPEYSDKELKSKKSDSKDFAFIKSNIRAEKEWNKTHPNKDILKWKPTKYNGTNPSELEMYENKKQYDEWQNHERLNSEVDRVSIGKEGRTNNYFVSYPEGSIVKSKSFKSRKEAQTFAYEFMDKN